MLEPYDLRADLITSSGLVYLKYRLETGLGLYGMMDLLCPTKKSLGVRMLITYTLIHSADLGILGISEMGDRLTC